jgi:hypothetical protein
MEAVLLIGPSYVLQLLQCTFFYKTETFIWNQFESCVGNEKLTLICQRILFVCNEMSGTFSNPKNVYFSYKLNAGKSKFTEWVRSTILSKNRD